MSTTATLAIRRADAWAAVTRAADRAAVTRTERDVAEWRYAIAHARAADRRYTLDQPPAAIRSTP